ncbi:MAG: hypothetical protein GXX92_04370 [Clostridiales bacterium]|nr:hypothetical protein [Clostridiales bacterium]
MSQLIREQIFGFCVMFFCGAGIAMLRQLFRSYQRDYRPRKSIFVIQEMLFWIIAALITSACLYYADYGAVTIHGVVGFTLGAFLWYNIRKHNAG